MHAMVLIGLGKLQAASEILLGHRLEVWERQHLLESVTLQFSDRFSRAKHRAVASLRF